jgi:hypothetical protein
MNKTKRVKKSEQLEVVGELRCDICGELHTLWKSLPDDKHYRFRYVMGCPVGKCGVLFTQGTFDYATQHRDYYPIDNILPKRPTVTLTTGSEGRNFK